MKTGICLTVKNEAPYLAEWIAFHSALNFDRIWIYDNGSSDKIDVALRPYSKTIELVAWHKYPAFPANVVDCLSRAQQAGVDWLALIDADEFIVPVDGNPSGIKERIAAAARAGVDEILVPMYFYTSEQQVLIPKGRVVDNYPTVSERRLAKSIVRVGSRPVPRTTHSFGSEKHIRVPELRINHYRNKSKEDDLIRRAKGFVDAWGAQFLSDAILDEERARREVPSNRPSFKNDAASHLSALFKTPGSQPDLGVDPIKIYIFERNQPNGEKLKEQLTPAFRDISFWDVGSTSPNSRADALFPNDGFTAQINRGHEQSPNSMVIWYLHADEYLNNTADEYKRAIVSAFPFGVWSPKINGRRRNDQRVPDGVLWSVNFVESVAWAVSRHARRLGFPLPEGSPLGWGQDLVLSRKCLQAGLRNLIDGRVSISHIHEATYQGYNAEEAKAQMEDLLTRTFPDGQTFGSPTAPRRQKNIIGEASPVA